MTTSTPPPPSDDEAQRFNELFEQMVHGHLQMAMMFLGRLANPQTGKVEAVNPEAAEIFIDQLDMLEFKTRGNLSNEEARLLAQALSTVRMTFVEVLGAGASKAGQGAGFQRT